VTIWALLFPLSFITPIGSAVWVAHAANANVTGYAITLGIGASSGIGCFFVALWIAEWVLPRVPLNASPTNDGLVLASVLATTGCIALADYCCGWAATVSLALLR
jgi:hypothetical protein